MSISSDLSLISDVALRLSSELAFLSDEVRSRRLSTAERRCLHDIVSAASGRLNFCNLAVKTYWDLKDPVGLDGEVVDISLKGEEEEVLTPERAALIWVNVLSLDLPSFDLLFPKGEGKRER